jgi:hypothetical protein
MTRLVWNGIGVEKRDQERVERVIAVAGEQKMPSVDQL